MHVLLVEDSHIISDSLKSTFENYGYLVDARKAVDFMKMKYNIKSFDIAVLNIEVEGLEKEIEKIRKIHPDLCIIGLNTSKNWNKKVDLLKTGFDDVLDYPFPAQEILVRVQNALKKPRNMGKPDLKAGNIKLDIEGKRVMRNNNEVDLRKKEFCLLEYLIRNKNRTVSRNELLDHVWDYRKISNSNTVDVHIKRLRDKIKGYDVIQTVHGFGYRLNDKQKVLKKTGQDEELYNTTDDYLSELF